MAFDPQLREILDESLKVDPENITVEQVASFAFNSILNTGRSSQSKTTSIESAKNIVEVMDLIEEAIRDYEKRTHVSEDAKVKFTYEHPDKDAELEAISIELTRREPGAHGQGRPFEAEVKQLKPLLREECDDPDNPGYRLGVLGQKYDNMLTLTCWARTNKAANARALWLETVMEEYSWFFGYSGVERVLYQGRRSEKKVEISNNKIYGRPIDYFVRTEKLRTVSQKTLEQICLRLMVKDG